MIDRDGVEWLPVAEAAERAGVRVRTVYVWIDRRLVTAHKIQRRAYVRVPDVIEAEFAWRKRERGGHRHPTRRPQQGE